MLHHKGCWLLTYAHQRSSLLFDLLVASAYSASMPDLRWVKNDVEGARFAFGGGRASPPLTYLGAPIRADFELTFENLAPFVTEVLDQAAPIEGSGLSVKLVEIEGGRVHVW